MDWSVDIDSNAITVKNFLQLEVPTEGRDKEIFFRVVKITYPKKWLATTNERSGREKNSSAFRAASRTLAAGDKDVSLDFGMVRRKVGLLPATR